LRNITSPICLYDILNLAEKYQLPSLKDIAENALKALPVNPENLIDFVDAVTFYHMFEDISNMLTEKCREFLQNNLRINKETSSMILTSHASNPLLLEILKGMPTCPNCNRREAECLDGQDVTGKEDPPVVRPDVIIRNKGWHDKSYDDCDCFEAGEVNYFTVEGLLKSVKQGIVKRWETVISFADLDPLPKLGIRVKCHQHMIMKRLPLTLDQDTDAFVFAYACKMKQEMYEGD